MLKFTGIKFGQEIVNVEDDSRSLQFGIDRRKHQEIWDIVMAALLIDRGRCSRKAEREMPERQSA